MPPRPSAAAHLVLPSAAYVEREGTFTNFEGRVQRFRTALDALGEARPDWDVFSAARPWRLASSDPGAHVRARRPGLPGPGRGGARLCRHELPRPRRRRPGGSIVSGVLGDLLALFGPVAFTMFVVLNLGRHLDLGRAQAIGDHAGSDRRQPRLDLRHPRHGAAPPARRRDQDADQGRLHADARGSPALQAGAVRVGILRARRLRLHPLRRHADRRRPHDRAAGGDPQRGYPLRARDAVDGRLRAHDGGLGLGQQLRAARGPAGGRPDDLRGDRHRGVHHGRGDDLRLAQHAGHRARPGPAPPAAVFRPAGSPPGAS